MQVLQYTYKVLVKFFVHALVGIVHYKLSYPDLGYQWYIAQLYITPPSSYMNLTRMYLLTTNVIWSDIIEALGIVCHLVPLPFCVITFNHNPC